MAIGVLDPCVSDPSSAPWSAESWQDLQPVNTTSTRLPGILIVDDDPMVRTLLYVLLQEDGFAVWLTADGYQAIKAYRGHRQDIDLVLLDVRMPGLDGPQTLAALQEFDPQLRCCFMTGDLGRYSEKELLERGAERILYKPFRLAALRQVLDELTNHTPPLHRPPVPAA